SGFIALSYQVFWTRSLVFRFDYLKNTTYSFSAMLCVFLIGLAAGSALMSLLVDRQRDPIRLYGLIQILIGLSGGFSLFMLIVFVRFFQFGDALNTETFEFNWLLAVANVFLRTALTIGLPTFLMGMAFPVAARICIRHLSHIGSGTGRLYAVNTIGAIFGSFAAGFVLIPLFGLARGLLVLGFANVMIGSIVLIANPLDTRRYRIVWTLLALIVIAVFFARVPKEYRFQDLPQQQRNDWVAYNEGPLATVSVIENSIGERTIYVDAVGVAGTDRILLTDQKSLAHVPMLILENPKSALTVGFGSGGASWSFTLYDELERIDCIEICETVPKVADTLKDSNHGVLDEWDGGPLVGKTFHDGRYRVIIDDARSYLRFSGRQYDIIATDCTDLRYKSNANLYDVEYFELCRDAITEDGMVVVWMPLGGMSPEVFACAMKTFAHVFPDMTIWYMNNEPTHYLLLLGTKKTLNINLDRMIDRINRPQIQSDLAEVSLQQPEKLLACFLEAAPALEEPWKNAPLNREYSPYLEFESPKFGYSDEPLLVNLDLLRRYRQPIDPYIEDRANHPDFMTRLRQFEKAIDPILEGHAHVRRLQVRDACRAYLRAQEICPWDKSIQFLLTFDTLRKRVQRYPDDLWPVLSLAEVLAMQSQPRKAANLFHNAIGLSSRMRNNAIAAISEEETADTTGPTKMLKQSETLLKRAVLGLARSYQTLGSNHSARQTLNAYQEIFPDDAEYLNLSEELDNETQEPKPE
ncbi:fused MFS/spermidine synthase, partial [bacterium]|nr:fused MFS/spermidine synthase [bacterium]